MAKAALSKIHCRRNRWSARKRERQSWTPPGGRDWHLLNTAESDDVHVPSWRLSSELENRCRTASAALGADEQQLQGAALLRRVARSLNDGPLLTYAREVRGEAERRDLRDSLPLSARELERLQAL